MEFNKMEFNKINKILLLLLIYSNSNYTMIILYKYYQQKIKAIFPENNKNNNPISDAFNELNINNDDDPTDQEQKPTTFNQIAQQSLQKNNLLSKQKNQINHDIQEQINQKNFQIDKNELEYENPFVIISKKFLYDKNKDDQAKIINKVKKFDNFLKKNLNDTIQKKIDDEIQEITKNKSQEINEEIKSQYKKFLSDFFKYNNYVFQATYSMKIFNNYNKKEKEIETVIKCIYDNIIEGQDLYNNLEYLSSQFKNTLKDFFIKKENNSFYNPNDENYIININSKKKSILIELKEKIYLLKNKNEYPIKDDKFLNEQIIPWINNQIKQIEID